MDLSKPVPELARGSAESPVLLIPWEAQDDVLPPAGKARGLCLSTKIGFVDENDFFRLGVVFSVQARSASGDWKPVFRRGLMRRARDWEQWDIPIESIARENSGKLQLRFITDSYTRAQDRNDFRFQVQDSEIQPPHPTLPPSGGEGRVRTHPTLSPRGWGRG